MPPLDWFPELGVHPELVRHWPRLMELLDGVRGGDNNRIGSWGPTEPSSSDVSLLLPGCGGGSGKLPVLENIVQLHPRSQGMRMWSNCHITGMVLQAAPDQWLWSLMLIQCACRALTFRQHWSTDWSYPCFCMQVPIDVHVGVPTPGKRALDLGLTLQCNKVFNLIL